MSKPNLFSTRSSANQHRWLMCLQAATNLYRDRVDVESFHVVDLADQFYQALEERRQPQE